MSPIGWIATHDHNEAGANPVSRPSFRKGSRAMMTLETNRPRDECREEQQKSVASRNLVLVASEPSSSGKGSGPVGAASSQSLPTVAGPNGLNCTRIAAHVMGASAAWCRRLFCQAGVSPLFEGPIARAPRRVADLPEHLSGFLELLDQADGLADSRKAIAGAIAALRSADAVIAGPFSPEDANSPGLLPHVADIAGHAYRALRPPRELTVHPAFGQIARRFQYIQMSEQEAHVLGAGARDLGVLAERLRRLQGDRGEFAIIAFAGRGLLWADSAWWEVDPITGAVGNESLAEAVFSMAWVVARHFRRAGAAHALAYARAVTASAVNPVRQNRRRLPSEPGSEPC
jgi:hypothetical protein